MSPSELLKRLILFLVNCLRGAYVDTGAAVNAELGIHMCFLTVHGDCCSRTLINAGLASGTFLFVNNSCHSTTLPVFFGKRK